MDGTDGAWPPVIERPAIDTLSESRRENFLQSPHSPANRAGTKPPKAGCSCRKAKVHSRPRCVVFYDPETSAGLNPKQTLRDFALQLTRRGFVTLSIGTPGGNAWKPDIGNAPCQPLLYHANVAANCWNALASLPKVDQTRIGVAGDSYGGKWAMFAAALWEKFAAVAVSDPGIVFDETRSNVNYWEPWYLGLDPKQTRKPGIPTAGNPRTSAYREMVARGRDLHEIHALIAPRPFLVSGGAEDRPERWIALNHSIAVNDLLGFTNRVAMTEPGERTTPTRHRTSSFTHSSNTSSAIQMEIASLSHFRFTTRTTTCKTRAWIHAASPSQKNSARSALRGALLTGTSEKDWDMVLALAATDRSVIPSLGADRGTSKRGLTIGRKSWSACFHLHVAIGEIGLDKWIRDADFEAQNEIFRVQLQLASKHAKPVKFIA